MLKQKLKTKSLLVFKKLPVVAMALVFILSSGGAPLVRADEFDQKINQLNSQSNEKFSEKLQLGHQATSLSDKITKLQSRINSLRAQIDKFQSEIDTLRAQIAAQQKELEHQKEVLGQNIKAIYLEGQISTLEMLASSKDLSEFVDKQQYRYAVQDKITTTMEKIVKLKQQLRAKQDAAQQKLEDKQTAETQLANEQAENNRLLNINKSQQNSLESQIKKNNSLVEKLRAAQIAANQSLGGNIVSGDPNRGGYPAQWDYPVPQDSLIDSWGMYNRECVSYTAWKVFQRFGRMPYWGGHGNANQWPASAQADGIPTGSTPRRHSVAVWNVGYYGHTMWVEDVLSNGYIRVSQYNYDFNGRYSEMTISGAGLTYIYFN